MRCRLTHEFGDEERQAVGHAMGCRRPASRQQCLQWLIEQVTVRKLAVVHDLRRFRINPDPHQRTFADLEQET